MVRERLEGLLVVSTRNGLFEFFKVVAEGGGFGAQWWVVMGR